MNKKQFKIIIDKSNATIIADRTLLSTINIKLFDIVVIKNCNKLTLIKNRINGEIGNITN